VCCVQATKAFIVEERGATNGRDGFFAFSATPQRLTPPSWVHCPTPSHTTHSLTRALPLHHATGFTEARSRRSWGLDAVHSSLFRRSVRDIQPYCPHAQAHTTMATRRQASLSAPSASTSSTNSATKKASSPQVPTAASTKHAYTASTNKAAAAAAAPVPLLPADVEDEQRGEMLAGTHYILEGPATGKLVVCVPGLGGPHWYFDELVPFLLQAGFRVLRYDLVGRGHSEPPPRTRRPSCFCNGVAREKDPYGTFIRLLCFLRGRDMLE